MEGSLPPDLQGMLYRVGPGRRDGAGSARGALHAVELRDGQAVSYLRVDSPADAGVFWHAGSVLALPEAGLPSQYSRLLGRGEFGGGLTVPIASHVHRVASDGARVLFSVDDGLGVGDDADARAGGETEVWLRLGEWDASGGLRNAQSVALERATWQHDIGVTEDHVVFIESPTRRLEGSCAAWWGRWVAVRPATMSALRRRPTRRCRSGGCPAPKGGSAWCPGAATARWCVGSASTRVWSPMCSVRGKRSAARSRAGRRRGCIGAGASGDLRDLALFVCRYDAPEPGQLVDLGASVVGPAGIGRTPIGGSLAVLERWRLVGDRLERPQLDDRHVEYPRMDQTCEGQAFRYGYAVELVATPGTSSRLQGQARLHV